MDDTFASRRRRILDALQSERMRSEQAPVPSLPAFNASLPQGLSPYARGYNAPAPMMEIAMRNPRAPMGGPQQSMGFGQLPLPVGSGPAPDMPAQGAANAGPASAPMPPQRPMMAQPEPSAPMPPMRPEGVGFNDPNRTIQGFNPWAAAGAGGQQFADKFAQGDLSKLGARTYYDENGNAWNDYYVR